MSSAKAIGARATKVAQQSIKSFFGAKGNKQRQYLTKVASELEIPLGDTCKEKLENIYRVFHAKRDT